MGEKNKKEKSIVKESIEPFVKHPILIGLGAGALNFLLNEKNIKPEFFKAENSGPLVYLVYLALSIANKYYVGPINPFETSFSSKKNLSAKIDEVIYNNKEITAMLASLLYSGSWNYYFKIPGNHPSEDFGFGSTFVAGSLLTELAIFSRKQFKEVKSINQLQTTKEKIYNFVFENPLIVAAPFAIERFYNTFNYLEKNSYTLAQHIPPALLSSLSAIATGLVAYTITTFAGSILHTNSLHRIKNNITKKEISLEDILLIQDPKQKAVAYSELANQYNKRKNEEQAIRFYRKSLKSLKNISKEKSHSDLLLSTLYIPEIKNLARTISFKLNTKPQLADIISQINIYCFADKPKKVENLIAKNFDNYSENPLFLSYLATLYDCLDYDSSGIWKRVIEILDAKEMLIPNYVSESDSGKKVFNFPNTVLEDCLFFAMGKNEIIKPEFKKTSLVYNTYSDDTKVARPIVLLEYDANISVALMSHANGCLINEKISKELLEKAVESLAEFHIRTRTLMDNIEIPVLEYKWEIERSIKKLGIDVKKQEQNIENYLSVMAGKLKNDYIIHNDLNMKNIFYVPESCSFCIIDFDTLCKGSKNIDLCSLLENDTLKLLRDRTEGGYRLYYSFNPNNQSYDQFREEQQFASIHKNLRMAGITSHRSQESDKKESQKNIESSVFYLNNLKILEKQLFEINKPTLELQKFSDFLHYIADDWESRHQ